MKTADTFTVLGARLLNPIDTQEAWRINDPILLPGELAIISDLGKMKIGTGKTFSNTPYMYGGADRFNIDYSGIPAVDDAKFKPPTSTGKNVIDYLQTNGDIIYPVTTTTATRLLSGITLQSWMNNVSTGDLTFTGAINATNSGITEKIIQTIAANNNGIDVCISGAGNTYIGSGEILINLSTEIAAASNNEYLFLSSDSAVFIYTNSNDQVTKTYLKIDNKVLTPNSSNTWSLGSSTLKFANVWATNLNGALKGNADTASKLATPRKINITGQVTGSIQFDGSTDVNIDVSLAQNITLGDGEGGTIEQNGSQYRQRLTFVDNASADDDVFVFSQSTDTGSSFKTLMQIMDNGNVKANTFIGALSGNSLTASKLQTVRSLTIGNTTKSFDGSGNVTWSLAEIGAIAASTTLTVTNISVPVASWNTSSKRFEYANASITAGHSPDVRFAKASMDAAGKAGIIAYTEAGKLVLEATTAVPTVAITIEAVIFTKIS